MLTISYDDISGTYGDKFAIVSVHYEKSETGMRSNKVKMGQLNLNLGKILNSKTYRINNTYPLDKCYDPAAKIKISVDFTRV